MPDPLLYSKAIAIAAIVSASMVLAIKAALRRSQLNGLNSASAFAIGAGLTAGYFTLGLPTSWPPTSGLDRLLIIVFPATLFTEGIAGLPRMPRWLAWLLRFSIAIAIPRILLHGSVYLHRSEDTIPWQAFLTIALSGGLLAALWSSLSWLSLRTPGVSLPLAICLAIQCAGAAIMMAGYIKGGSAAFPLAATLVGATLAAKYATKDALGEAKFQTSVIVGISVVGLFGVVFIGNFFGRITTGSALTLTLSPILCWATELPLLRNRSPRLIGSVRLALVALPLIVVLVLAKHEFDLKMAPLLP